MHIIHRIVGMTLNPLGIAVGLLAFGVLCRRMGWRRLSRMFFCVDAVAVLLMSLPIVNERVSKWVERDYPCVRVENLPEADAVVLLGGGIGAPPEGSDFPYPNLADGADRIWHAARIWQAKGVKIYCTSPDVSLSTPPFLKDLGVPQEAIVPLDGPRNTEEEAKKYAEVLKGKRVYLVTSASHMKRATMIFAKYAPELSIVPAAIDHLYVECPVSKHPWLRFVPSFGTFCQFNVVLHELLGLVRYSLL